MKFRIGINQGDVVFDDKRLYGDGVNVAARLEAIAEPGGICVSGKVFDEVRTKIGIEFIDMGEQRLKNITEPVRVYRVVGALSPKGWGKSSSRARRHVLAGLGAAAACGAVSAVGWRYLPSDNALVSMGANAKAIAGTNLTQEIRYARAADGVRIAYAIAGSGPPLAKAGNWLSHLEYEWVTPIWRHLMLRLAEKHTLVRYYARGNGMSDWEVKELSLDGWVGDLATVVDAIGLKRFPLLGISQGSGVCITYAVRHPERVSHLILYGGYAVGRRRRSPEAAERSKAFATLMRQGWGRDNPAFRQLFTGRIVPGASKEQMDLYNELQRKTATPEGAARYAETMGEIDVRELLAN